MSNCTVEGCDRPQERRAWCRMHYARWYRHADPTASQLDRHHPATCSVEGCDRPYDAGGLCGMHWQRVYAGKAIGPAETLRPRRLTPRPPAKYHRKPDGAGNLRPDGYYEDTVHGHPLAVSHGRVLRHRRLLFDAIGPDSHPCHMCGRMVAWGLPLHRGGLVVDHIDRNRGNNSLSNLAPACHSCNSAWRRGIRG